ncbi:hypothetical protein DSUL_260041 [Desulfovibrionales bacterium]
MQFIIGHAIRFCSVDCNGLWLIVSTGGGRRDCIHNLFCSLGRFGSLPCGRRYPGIMPF